MVDFAEMGWTGGITTPSGCAICRNVLRRTPRHRFNATDTRAGLAGWGGISEIYLRHADPTTGIRLVHLDVRGANGRGSQGYGAELAEFCGQLDDSKSQLWNTRTQVREMEIELLELTRSKDALRVDLPKRAIEDYKKSPGFEMGLIRMGRVSLEYSYQPMLARLRARHPGVEIE
ncbi:hypothetical protein GW17_00059330 [Ensete ventricosum]|nr:hypothetical protein GW17_00059330 [Ensete ventricosum]